MTDLTHSLDEIEEAVAHLEADWYANVVPFVQVARTALLELVAKVRELEAIEAEVRWRLAEVLDHATGGLLSKTNYPTRVMTLEIDAYTERLIEEAIKDRAEDEAVES